MIAKFAPTANHVLRLGCIDSPIVGPKVDDAKNCAPPAKLFSSEAMQVTDKLKALAESMDAQTKALESSNRPNIFELKADSPSDAIDLAETEVYLQRFTLQPKCFHAPAQDYLKPFSKRAGFGASPSYRNEAEIEYDLNEYVIYLGADEPSRISPKLKTLKQTAKIRFNPHDLSKTGSSAVITRVTGEAEKSKILKLCPSSEPK